MNIGTLSRHFNLKTVSIFFLQFFLVIAALGYHAWKDSSAECVRCHSDRVKMTALGYPQFYMTPQTVQKESKHPNVKCRECHLGNGRSTDPAGAHAGMLSVLLVDDNGTVLKRKDAAPAALLPSGDDMIRRMLPKVDTQPNSGIRNVLWHDRDPESFNFDPEIAGKTCGKPACHPEELKQFRTVTMGTNFRQRTMHTWLKPYGPHNCGPSFSDLPPEAVLKEAGFSMKNTEEIAAGLNVPFTQSQARDKQKFCNVCHAGCLDCHYGPDPVKGAHNFTAKPSAVNCLGYGRGTSMCHSGAMQSRRGETYAGGDYSIPTGMKPDIHYTKDIQCVDCHLTGEKGMGDMQRKADCQDCHLEIEEAHAKGIHDKLHCAACHVNELRGYQITIWGPGRISGRENPFKKYSLYYGVQGPPILMKDQKGMWMPVKVWPHSVGNIKPEVKPSDKIMFRWPNGETRDAYYVVGTFDAPSNNRHLLWLEIEQAAHPYGRARKCGSCHGQSQTAVSTWQFMDDQGATGQFKGSHRIVADTDGLRIIDLKNTTPIEAARGYKLEDFASWLFFKDRWRVPGDFSISADKAKYRKHLNMSREIETVLKRIEQRRDLEIVPAAGVADVSIAKNKFRREYKKLKGYVLHDDEGALGRLRDYGFK